MDSYTFSAARVGHRRETDAIFDQGCKTPTFSRKATPWDEEFEVQNVSKAVANKISQPTSPLSSLPLAYPIALFVISIVERPSQAFVTLLLFLATRILASKLLVEDLSTQTPREAQTSADERELVTRQGDIFALASSVLLGMLLATDSLTDGILIVASAVIVALVVYKALHAVEAERPSPDDNLARQWDQRMQDDNYERK